MILYRILSIIISLICAFLGMALLFTLMAALANPAMWFSFFLVASVILYGWFSNRFFAQVVVAQKPMSKRQKDWLQVNAIMTLLFAVLGIVSGIQVLGWPENLDEIIKELPADMATNVTTLLLYKIFLGETIVCLLFAIHVIWTYLLVRKYKNYFTA